MGLAAAELRDQRHDRCRIVSSPCQSAQHHAHVFAQGAGEAGAGEEFRRVAVVVGSLVRGYLLKGDGEFTIFAPTNAALASLPAHAQQQNKAQLDRMMGYLVVPGRYDSQTLLRVIGEGGGQAKLRTAEGGVLVARLNGPTNVVLMDEKGATADISIYDIYERNGVIQVVDHALEPGAASGQMASR